MCLESIIPATDFRFIFVHYHIFKNAGTTIERILAREFAGRFATVHGRNADSVLDAEDLLAFLREHPEIDAVSSHHLRYPKPQSRRIVFFDCCFLRDPIERLYSSYLHFRRRRLDDLTSRQARTSGPREFAEHWIDNSPHQVSDVQVNQLANAGAFMRPADEQDLDRAMAVIPQMGIPGLVEMFDESMVIAEYFLRPAFPSLRLEYLPENLSCSPRPMHLRSARDWQEIWGRDIHELLLRMNALDLELVRRMRSEILRRAGHIPQFPERLADFRSRCARLSSTTDGFQPARPIPAGLAQDDPIPVK